MPMDRSLSEAGAVPARTDLMASVWHSPDYQEQLVGLVSAERMTHTPVPWWLWWNILSVDAPTVAVIWAALFARASGIRLSTAEAAVLVLAVWVIYMSDRLLDGWTARHRTALRERHFFCAGHRFVLAVLVLSAVCAIFWVTMERLQAAEVSAGVKLGLLLAAYMASIHAGRERIARFLPKELVVGFLFAAGATLPFWSRAMQFSWHAWLPWVLFGLLCSLNCMSIECWENREPGAVWKQTTHPLIRWADTHINRIAATLALAALAVYLARDSERPSGSGLLAISIGASLILLLNCGRNKVSPVALRVLADAALVLPALIALGVRG
jgi:hypothetical protein